MWGAARPLPVVLDSELVVVSLGERGRWEEVFVFVGGGGPDQWHSIGLRTASCLACAMEAVFM